MKKFMNLLAQQIVKELLTYEPSSGYFYWKSRDIKWFKGTQHRTAEHDQRLWESRFAHTRAGCECKTVNTRRICIFGGNYEEGRLAYLYMTGEVPELVRHINGNGLDSSFRNLLASTVVDKGIVLSQKNKESLLLRRNNKTGITGVRYNKKDKAWIVRMGFRGIKVKDKYYKDFFEACCARKSLELKLGSMPYTPPQWDQTKKIMVANNVE